MSTANTPHSDPDTKANNTAATAPPRTRPATTQPASSGPSTRATTAQVRSGAPAWPVCGLPTTTTTVTAAVSRAAHTHSPAVTARCDSRALMGRAKSTENISSACTSNTEPPPRAAACNPLPASNSAAPHHHHHHRWLRSSPANNSTGPNSRSVMQCAARCCNTSPVATHSAELNASNAAMISVRATRILRPKVIALQAD